MSELKIVTPEECTIPEETKRKLVDDVNNALMSGTRLYNVSLAHVEFLKQTAAASGWIVSAQHYAGDTMDVVFFPRESK